MNSPLAERNYYAPARLMRQRARNTPKSLTPIDAPKNVNEELNSDLENEGFGDSDFEGSESSE